MMQFEKNNGISSLDGWYTVHPKKIIEAGGQTLLGTNKGSIIAVLKSVYPEHDWKEWLFDVQVPKQFWRIQKNISRYFDWLSRELGFSSLDAWYGVRAEQLHKSGASTFIGKHHNSSLFSALKSAYPNHEWQPWKFTTALKGMWNELSMRKKFFDWAGQQLGVKAKEDWYTVPSSEVSKLRGGHMLQTVYQRSLFDALCDVYPNHHWRAWRFSRVPKGFWESATVENLQDYLNEMGSKLKVGALADWYRISSLQLKSIGALHAVEVRGGLLAALTTAFPDHPWEKSRFDARGGKKSVQRMMLHALQQIFPTHEIKEDFTYSSMEYTESARSLQLDFYIPTANLALEYQGVFHDADIQAVGSHKHIELKDAEKALLCRRANITLISVPNSWDGKKDSLQQRVLDVRPDLTSQMR